MFGWLNTFLIFYEGIQLSATEIAEFLTDEGLSSRRTSIESSRLKGGTYRVSEDERDERERDFRVYGYGS